MGVQQMLPLFSWISSLGRLRLDVEKASALGGISLQVQALSEFHFMYIYIYIYIGVGDRKSCLKINTRTFRERIEGQLYSFFQFKLVMLASGGKGGRS